MFIMLQIFMMRFTVVDLAQFMQQTLQWPVSTFTCCSISLCFQWSRVMKAYAVPHCALGVDVVSIITPDQ